MNGKLVRNNYLCVYILVLWSNLHDTLLHIILLTTHSTLDTLLTINMLYSLDSCPMIYSMHELKWFNHFPTV